ncbi:MAG: N-acetylneuraminate synthase family protein [Rhodobacteraceae bacterium]|nr:N-acetylneuraminate synthase family protein [Paracoccaceae bacterium]MCF8521044.1 N-acetylneuraminate synthase family protein [Paracoccaceae bacterium]
MSHVYVIAEAGMNHNGRLDLAEALVDAAAGADAVKFQTYKADALALASAPKAAYQDRQIPADISQYAMLKALAMPGDWHGALQARTRARGIDFLSTAFDFASLDFLETLDMLFYKVPSGELTNAPLLWRFARTLRPLLVSSGMATLSEVEQALAVISHAREHASEPASMAEVWQAYGAGPRSADVTLLHCTSQYPTPMAEVNLAAMGSGIKAPQPSEWDTRRAERQTLVAARDIPAGTLLTRDDLTTARAGQGRAASALWDMVGTTTKRAYRRGEGL